MQEEPSGSATAVVIYGRTYHLRGSEDPGYLEKLAGIVDAKMREAADATGAADTLKVAILASLNLADECLRAERGTTRESGMDAEVLRPRMARMVAQLEEALLASGELPHRAGEGLKDRAR